MAYGFVYLAWNQCMPGIVKIGMTEKAPLNRVSELSASTGVPVPFDLVRAWEVRDPLAVESAVHSAFSERRVNDRREFFKATAKEVIDYVESTGEAYGFIDYEGGQVEALECEVWNLEKEVQRLRDVIRAMGGEITHA